MRSCSACWKPSRRRESSPDFHRKKTRRVRNDRTRSARIRSSIVVACCVAVGAADNNSASNTGRRRGDSKRSPSRDSATGKTHRASHARAREFCFHWRIPKRVQRAGNGVLRSARIPTRRRSAHDRLERHRAYGTSIRKTIHRGARADGDACRRSFRV